MTRILIAFDLYSRSRAGPGDVALLGGAVLITGLACAGVAIGLINAVWSPM